MRKKCVINKCWCFIISAVALIGSCTACSDENTVKVHEGMHSEYEDYLFEKGKLNDIQINMTDWDDYIQKEQTKKNDWVKLNLSKDKKIYSECDVIINGEQINKTGIRTKGIYTKMFTIINKADRFSFVMKFNEYTDKQKYHGLHMIDLNSNIIDPTSMKDAVTYDMCRYLDLPAPLCNFAKITVNGEYFGCYLVVEPVGKDFCKRSFGEDYGSLYKPMHDLSYEKLFSYEEYNEIANKKFSLKKYNGIRELIKIKRSPFSNVSEAIESIHNGQNIEEHADVDSILKYLAVQVFAMNLDGLTGNTAHNYYLYESDGLLSLIPWDYDLAYGGKLNSADEMDELRAKAEAAGNFSLDDWKRERDDALITETKQIINLPVDTPFTCDLSEREFFMNILSNEEYCSRYHEYLRKLAEEYVKGGVLDDTVKLYSEEIKDIVCTEDNLFYDREEYEKAVEMLKLFLQKKSESVIAQLNGTIPSSRDEQQGREDTFIDTSDLDIKALRIKTSDENSFIAAKNSF